MSNTYSEGCAEFDIGKKGNALLVLLHKQAVKMLGRGSDWRTTKPVPSKRLQRFYEALRSQNTHEVLLGNDEEWRDLTDCPDGTVKLSEGGVILHGDAQFPDGYFTELVQFVLQELKLPHVVGWECSVRCDKHIPKGFGGFITCVSARGTRKDGTSNLLSAAKKELVVSMALYLMEGGAL
jgi:hypothetical protein